MKRFLALAAAALFTLAVPAAASAAPDLKDVCKGGGYAEYVDPDTAAPFADQGRCIAFVNEGGELRPVGSAPPSGGGVADIEFLNPRLDRNVWEWDLNLSGLPADTVVEVSWTQSGQKRVGPLFMSQPDGTVDLGASAGYAFAVRWPYGTCEGPPFITDVTVRGAGFKVTEAMPAPPACTP